MLYKGTWGCVMLKCMVTKLRLTTCEESHRTPAPSAKFNSIARKQWKNMCAQNIPTSLASKRKATECRNGVERNT